ncbi:hypothetical protein [Caldalkalibacillus salinus]|uniref:hypothetical protein n=1 Tax=Caldalkalibacillus salinus TaxID=2803787 RepID=UPI001F1CFDE0|nr:hypothetical protein [Caldalkalibacillus salinus]
MLVWSLLLLVISGCMYPAERKAENQVPHTAQIEAVASAIERYTSDRGVPPIRDFDADTPLYDRYVINFQELVSQYLERPPGNSFEAGGVFQYVITNPEEEPTVKLRDVRLSQTVRDVQMRLNMYLNEEDTYLPVDEMIENRYFTLDYEELGLRETPLVESPYTKQKLPLVVDAYGRVGIDYRPDLYQYLERYGDEGWEEADDLRTFLVEDSYFVPTHSYPYVYEEGEIKFKRE